MTIQANCVFSDFIDFNVSQKLDESLQSPHYQIGFICSIQALSEEIEISQWLSYLSIDGADISFANESEAADYGKNIIKLIEYVQDHYQNSIALTELQCVLSLNEQQNANMETVEFCIGFLSAIELFNDKWLVIEELDTTQELFQTTVLLLTKLAPPENTNPELKDLFEQLPEEDQILTILPQLFSHLAYTVAQNTTGS